jgi:arylsulfatase A-like enzyme
MNRLLSLVAAWALCCFASPLCQAADNSPPNVVVVLADDQGWGDLSLHGNPNLSTPNIDSLARDGAQIKNFYVCAVCSPTRAEFLTGRYHNRMGVYSTSTGGERFDLGEQTLAELFQQAGYATAAYGKWHSGMQWPYHPNARGFDDYYGFCSGHWANYFDPMLEHNGQIVKGNGFIIDDLTDHAIDFISGQRETPFFVYLPLNTPHSPMQVPQPFWDRFKDKKISPDPQPNNAKREDVQHTRAALAMVENIDTNVGRLLDHLERTELAENTIVVYFSDNGPNGWRYNGGLRGRKGSTTEGGLRSPCLIRFPKKIEPGTEVRSVGAAIDLLPTLAELAGIDWKGWKDPKRPLDGMSLATFLTGQAPADARPERTVFSAWRKGRYTARTQRYRMHSNGQLYDIDNDPRELNDIAKNEPDLAKRLMAEIDRWTQSWNAESARPARPFTVGHPEAEWTQLPARDATFSGAIKRSNRFPNCTYLLNWKDTESAIRWDVEVLHPGTFEVQMYYACPKEDVGATIELTDGEATLSSTITHPVESPLVGAEHDRVERQEGYVRWWQPTTMGKITLDAGPKTLTLRAKQIPGSQAAEMRLLMLRRLE